MAHRFPGRPPGTAPDLSDSNTMASSIGDYLEEFEGVCSLSFDDEDSFWNWYRQQYQQQQQQQRPASPDLSDSFSTMASSDGDYLEEDDEIYRVSAATLSSFDAALWRQQQQQSQHQQHQRHQRQRQQLQHKAAAASLVPSQVYKFCNMKFSKPTGIESTDSTATSKTSDLHHGVKRFPGRPPGSRQQQQQQQQRHHQQQSPKLDVDLLCVNFALNPTSYVSTGMHQFRYSKNDIRHYFGHVLYCPNESPCGSAVPTLKERRAYFNTKTSCPNIKTSKVWREPVPLDIFAKLALSDRVRSAQYPSAFDPFARHPFDPPDSRLVPSQVPFSPLKGASIGFGDEVSVAAENVSDVADTTVSVGPSAEVSILPDTNVSDGNYTAVSVLADGEASDDNVTEAYILADKTVRDGIYTGFGLGNSFVPFTTTPEEEIIFESQDSTDSAFAAALYYHAFPPCVSIRCRRSSLRWVTALIYKLLLIAWDLWQYKT